MKELPTPFEAMGKCKYIAGLVRVGAITYEDGKSKCKPLLEIINKRGIEIAKKHGVKHRRITYTGLLR